MALSSAAAKAAAVASGLTPAAPESKANKAVSKPEPKPAKATAPAAITEQIETITQPEPAVTLDAPDAATESPVEEDARYGESLVRELLGGVPIEDPKNGR